MIIDQGFPFSVIAENEDEAKKKALSLINDQVTINVAPNYAIKQPVLHKVEAVEEIVEDNSDVVLILYEVKDEYRDGYEMPSVSIGIVLEKYCDNVPCDVWKELTANRVKALAQMTDLEIHEALYPGGNKRSDPKFSLFIPDKVIEAIRKKAKELEA